MLGRISPGKGDVTMFQPNSYEIMPLIEHHRHKTLRNFTKAHLIPNFYEPFHRKDLFLQSSRELKSQILFDVLATCLELATLELA
jgi:hypothetical protein